MDPPTAQPPAAVASDGAAPAQSRGWFGWGSKKGVAKGKEMILDSAPVPDFDASTGSFKFGPASEEERLQEEKRKAGPPKLSHLAGPKPVVPEPGRPHLQPLGTGHGPPLSHGGPLPHGHLPPMPVAAPDGAVPPPGYPPPAAAARKAQYVDLFNSS